MTEPIRVVLVDDHAMVRRGLAAFLRAFHDLVLVGEAANGKEAVQVCTELQPDVVLMDLVMPELDGAAATRMIRERCPDTQVVALTSFKETDLVQGVLEAGAIGYLLKNVSIDELAGAIRAAKKGQPTLAPEAVQTLALDEKLQRLGQALATAAHDASDLPGLLREHVPPMFPDSQIEIRLFPDVSLLRCPAEYEAEAPVWAWLQANTAAQCFPPGARLPWGGHQPAWKGVLLAPIVDVEHRESLGGLCVLRRGEPDLIPNWLSAGRSLAAQISSTLHAARVYARTVAEQRVARELALAGRIQSSFLPDLPEPEGWEIAATLEPVGQTSGDFYDFIPLPDGRLGFVVADVADKGMGAALYMALCRTLIRTYADEHPGQPDRVLARTNHRILMDARAGLFVTAFYGVLDPVTGILTYGNAGHHPPLLLDGGGDSVQLLGKTGMALGVLAEETWRQTSIQVLPGHTLVLYSDGITEMQDESGEPLGKERLLELTRSSLRPTARGIQEALLAGVHAFSGSAPQGDDITLVVMSRKDASATAPTHKISDQPPPTLP